MRLRLSRATFQLFVEQHVGQHPVVHLGRAFLEAYSLSPDPDVSEDDDLTRVLHYIEDRYVQPQDQHLLAKAGNER